MSYKQYNPAKSTSYAFTVTNRNDISLKLQNASIGSVNLGMTPFPSQKLDMMIPSNKLDFGPINLRFLVSEHLTEWLDVYRWMIDITKTNGSHINSVEVGELTVFDAENMPILRFIYKGIYPITLGDLPYSLSDEETSLVCDLTVSFDSFDVEVITTGEIIKYGEVR
jgi:hypothetical protein